MSRLKQQVFARAQRTRNRSTIGRVVSAELAAPECRWDAQHTPDFDTKAQTCISRAGWIKILGIKYMKGLRVK